MLEADMAAALLSAMTAHRADRSAPAWQALERLVRAPATRHPELARHWRTADAAVDDPVDSPRLAHTLARLAAWDGELREEVVGWLERYATPTRPANAIGGSAHLHGPTVQAGEVHGGVHFHHSPTPRAPLPRQLPPPRTLFVDREPDLRVLDELRSAQPLSTVLTLVVSGSAGVGKTALLTHWLAGRQAEFPDGQLYADLGGYAPSGPRDADEVLEHFLRALGAASIPARASERVTAWRSLTAGRRLAVMLDNALTAAQVRPLLPTGGGSLVAVTSRGHLSGLLVEGATLHRLEALASEASVELLTRAGGGDRVRQDPHATDEVVHMCAGLPLALCLAAAQLAVHPRRPLSALSAELSKGRGPLETLRADGEATVRSALEQSYRLLPTPVAATYRRLGLLPSASYDTDMVVASTDGSAEQVADALETLTENSLLEEIGTGRYRFHDLVRQHARQRGEREEGAAAQRRTVRRFVDWCLAVATAAEAILTPSHRTLARDFEYPPARPPVFDDDVAALDWLKDHQSTLERTVRHCAMAGWDRACWQLVDALWPLFLRLRPAEWWIAAHTLALASARRAGDRSGVARMLTSGGAGLRNAGRHREAADWYAHALRQAEEDGDPRQQAQALNGLGNAYLASDELAEATASFLRALALREESGYRRGAALTRLCLGQTALAGADHEQAVTYFARAHSELVEERDTYDAARALAFLGQVNALRGERRTGMDQLRAAGEQFLTAGSSHWYARSLEMLGQACEHHGDARGAADCYRRARRIYTSLSPADADRLTGRLRGCDPGSRPEPGSAPGQV